MNQTGALLARTACIALLVLALVTAGAGCAHKKKGASPAVADSAAVKAPSRPTVRQPEPSPCPPPIPPTPQSELSQAVRAQREADLRNQFRLASLTLGAPIYIRIFKKSKELELWVQRGERFQLFKKYPIAKFSGGLGPKLREGDLQAPEGFYQVTAEHMNPWSNFHLAFNIGYPNEYDLLRGATGGAIMVHGKRESIGCFAMTDPAIEEIYTIADFALNSGQLSFPVHIFPFRMTVANLMQHAQSSHLPFWRNLLRGYTLFELTRTPPVVSINNQMYAFTKGVPSRPNMVAQLQQPAVRSAQQPRQTVQPTSQAVPPQSPVVQSPPPGARPPVPPAQQASRLTQQQAPRLTPQQAPRLTQRQPVQSAMPARSVRRSGQVLQ